MRTIEFRGKSTKWCFGDLEYSSKRGVARIHMYKSNGDYDGQVLVDPDTIGQFTGLYDKNGDKIYEGDIIKIVEKFDNEPYNAEVKFYKGVFGVENWTENTRNRCLTSLNHFMSTIGLYDDEQEYTVEVIGNVYDNKELLTKK